MALRFASYIAIIHRTPRCDTSLFPRLRQKLYRARFGQFAETPPYLHYKARQGSCKSFQSMRRPPARSVRRRGRGDVFSAGRKWAERPNFFRLPQYIMKFPPCELDQSLGFWPLGARFGALGALDARFWARFAAGGRRSSFPTGGGEWATARSAPRRRGSAPPSAGFSRISARLPGAACSRCAPALTAEKGRFFRAGGPMRPPARTERESTMQSAPPPCGGGALGH